MNPVGQTIVKRTNETENADHVNQYKALNVRENSKALLHTSHGRVKDSTGNTVTNGPATMYGARQGRDGLGGSRHK